MTERFTIGPAAGWYKTPEDIENVVSSTATRATAGGYTPKARDKNPGMTYIDTLYGSLNTQGLPNRGIDSLDPWFPRIVERAAKIGKTVVPNVAAFSPDEYGEVALKLKRMGLHRAQFNKGCPNVWSEGSQKPIPSLNLNLMREGLTAIRSAVGYDFGVEVKVSPLVDPTMFEPMWKIFIEFGVDRVVSMNTVPNCALFDEHGKPTITFGSGLAGLAGRAIKLFALGQVMQWVMQRTAHHSAVNKYIHIEGVGGIACARDVVDMHHAGADSVSIGTACFEQGPRIFGEIFQELPDKILDLAAE